MEEGKETYLQGQTVFVEQKVEDRDPGYKSRVSSPTPNILPSARGLGSGVGGAGPSRTDPSRVDLRSGPPTTHPDPHLTVSGVCDRQTSGIFFLSILRPDSGSPSGPKRALVTCTGDRGTESHEDCEFPLPRPPSGPLYPRSV